MFSMTEGGTSLSISLFSASHRSMVRLISFCSWAFFVLTLSSSSGTFSYSLLISSVSSSFIFCLASVSFCCSSADFAFSSAIFISFFLQASFSSAASLAFLATSLSSFFWLFLSSSLMPFRFSIYCSSLVFSWRRSSCLCAFCWSSSCFFWLIDSFSILILFSISSFLAYCFLDASAFASLALWASFQSLAFITLSYLFFFITASLLFCSAFCSSSSRLLLQIYLAFSSSISCNYLSNFVISSFAAACFSFLSVSSLYLSRLICDT